jgi:predicted nuclease of predicted toxin-antitoxin system
LSAKAPDPAIVRAARDEDRIIISFDLDFAALVALSRQTCPSVITLRLSIRSAE